MNSIAPVRSVENFVFLGSPVPNSSDEIKRRIAMASSAFGRLNKSIWKRTELTNDVKLRLYR